MNRKLSIVIAAHNEAKTIGPLVRRLLRWHRRPEVIVIANGCTDGTGNIAKMAGARVVRFRTRLGPDIGRAIGISLAHGDILLVLDADVAVTIAQLEPFVRAVERGADIALNRYPLFGTKQFHHPTAVAKHALNVFADRPDLLAASLTAIPHAISRRAALQLGPLAFCVPPVAQARALCSNNLKVEVAAHVPVGRLNRRRGPHHELTMRRLIIGDCLEGMSVIIQERGSRGGFTDLSRKRHLVTQMPVLPRSSVDTAVIVPTQGEETLRQVLKELRRLHLDQVRLVLNGTSDTTLPDVKGLSVQVDHYRDPVGHDVGRAIGCMQVDAAKYFFTDADIILPKAQVQPFLAALDEGVDIALNHLDAILAKRRQIDPPSIVKRFLNIACERPDLGVASLTAVPHAVSRRTVEQIGAEAFAVPPVAQVKAILAGLKVMAVHPVDVIHTNAARPHLHDKSVGRPLQKLIIGDYVEAIHCLQQTLGDRGAFPDNVRRRTIAEQYIVNHFPMAARS
ncbi:glycosyltransferase [Alicyclobacillus fodiniaquatilis]|uniref:4,4'-diaponeurosporenoate glycosyltransferase n=1 Tax=Alicyclobacillus fodiniaquatilis TaxID=1661150 RepID=A0ABW4JM52_9BACL